MQYRIYVDEVGNSSLKRPHIYENRFLSLTGVIVDLDYARDLIASEIGEMKQQYFDMRPDQTEPLHRTKLVRAKHPFQALKDPEVREHFDNTLLSCLQNWDYRVISVCLDKHTYIQVCPHINHDPYHYCLTVLHDPYHYCLTVLMEHYADWLMNHHAQGDVMVEARGRNEDRELNKHFRSLFEHGTETNPEERFQATLTSREIKVNGKRANDIGLQFADLLAYPSHNKILSENNLLEGHFGGYATNIANVLDHKFDPSGEPIYVKHLMP